MVAPPEGGDCHEVGSGAGRELVDPALELVEPGLQGDALGLGLGRDPVEPAAELRFDLVRAHLEGPQRLVPLTVESAAMARVNFAEFG